MRRGFTLAEVLLALLLIVLSALSLIGVLTGGLRLMSRSEELTLATELARSVVERIKEMDPVEIPEQANFDGGPPTSGGFPPEPYPLAERNGREYRVSVVTNPAGLHSVRVLVTISWNSGGRLSFETLVAK